MSNIFPYQYVDTIIFKFMTLNEFSSLQGSRRKRSGGCAD